MGEMGEIVKSGTLSKYSDSVFGKNWKKTHVTINRDSWMRWYERQGDSQPKRSVQLKKVAPYLAFGEATLNIPFKPDVPKPSVSRLLAVPHESNRNTRLSFFLCGSDEEMKEWVEAIMRTLPPPPQHRQLGQQPGAPPQYPGSSAPPGGPQAPIQPQTSAPSYAPGPPGGPQPGYNAPPPYPGTPPYQGGPPGAPPIGFNFAGPRPPAQQGYHGQPPPQSSYPPPPQQPYYPQPPGGYAAPPGGYAAPHGYAPPPGGYALPPGGYAPPPGGYAPPPGGYPQASGAYPKQAAYPQQMGGMQPAPQQQVVVVEGRRKKKGIGRDAMLGFAAGAAGAMVVGGAASHMMHPCVGYGGGWGGGWGWHGSWSSLSSFGSCGSFGSWSD